MTEKAFREMIVCNEPLFTFRNEDYQILQPTDRFLAGSVNNEDSDEWFDTVNDLLSNWKLDGVSLKDALAEIQYQ
ncbi:MAG: hypothetical protein RSD01_08700 [Ruthenibacterium sp.]